MRRKDIRSWTVSAGLALLGLAIGGSPAAAQLAPGEIRGTVTVVGPDGVPFNVPGVSLVLNGPDAAAEPLAGWSDASGEFRFRDIAPGTYRLDASLQGFNAPGRVVTLGAGETVVADVELTVAGVQETVTVTAEDGIDGLQERKAAPPPELKQATLQAVPLAKEQFVEALPLIPGVVRGPDGLLNVKGSRASQSGLTVNSANVTDPVTGEYAINLPIEAIESVQVRTNPYAAEFGKFSGGVTSIETRSGGSDWKVRFQNFFPRPRRRDGKTVGVEAFTPRLTLGGPVARETLTVLQSFQYRFTRAEVESLPPLERDTELESFDSYTRLDWHPGASDHLTTSVSVFPQKQRYVGLNTFNPREVTPRFKQRGAFWAVQHRRVLNNASLLESFVSVKQFDADVFPSTAGGPMILAPDANSGSFFNAQSRDSVRVEAVETYTFSPSWLGPSHVVKSGFGVSHGAFDGVHESRALSVVRADGSRSRLIEFFGGTAIEASSTDVLLYVQDEWAAHDSLTVEYGIRYDRDSLTRDDNVAPRAAFAFRPRTLGQSVIRGGAGLFYDKTNLNVAAFEQLQGRTIASFFADGLTIAGSPVRQVPRVEGGRFRTPRSVNWNLAFDREWWPGLLVGVGYQQREGRREYVIDPVGDSVLGQVLLLGTSGRSTYREFQVIGRYRFLGDNQVVASYVRSSATGDLNDFNTIFGNFENPVILPNERARLAWDAPNRFLVWGDFGLPYGFDVAPVFEVRDGFPLSLVDESRDAVGPRNGAGRFPIFAALDLQVVKTLRLPGPLSSYRAKVGVRVFNLLNRFNPRDFQGNLGSGAFGQFFNGVDRAIRGKLVIEF